MALVGDHERQRAADLLNRHYQRGRLSLEELSERLELALRARRDSDVRSALADLPASWREQTRGLRFGFDDAWRAARRTAFVVAVWMLWWAASMVLLIGFVISLLVQGLALGTAATFAVLWLLCTFAARRVSRRPYPRRSDAVARRR
jgi:Flp pilus assembly protein TadB